MEARFGERIGKNTEERAQNLFYGTLSSFCMETERKDVNLILLILNA
jgi:hypothetical protein